MDDAMDKMQSKLFKIIKPNPSATCRLFCFPYAGGTASIYKEWADKLSPHIEICAIQMPGREQRLAEEPYLKIEEVVDEFLTYWDQYDNRPYAFFGHSLGAIIGFEIARKLEMFGENAPELLFLSGCAEPKIKDKEIHHLPREEFLQEIKNMGGTPDLVFQHEELINMFLPMLRADFTMIEKYEYKEGPPLNCRLVVYGGSDDTEVGFTQLIRWSDYTTSNFDLKKIKGGHFFLKESLNELLLSVRNEFQNQFTFHI